MGNEQAHKMNIEPNNNTGEDFVLTGRSAWLRIDGYSLLISNHEDRVSAKLFILNKENEDEIDGFAWYKQPYTDETFK